MGYRQGSNAISDLRVFPGANEDRWVVSTEASGCRSFERLAACLTFVILDWRESPAPRPARCTGPTTENVMVHSIKLKKIGGSVGAILPKELLQRQHLAANDELFVLETPDGILLTAVDPATRVALAAYAEVARENRAALAALAKL